MKTESGKEYLLLFRGTQWDKGLSPGEIQEVVSGWARWFDGLMEAGIARAGQPLGEEGKLVSDDGGRTVVDGRFADSKEAVAGYFLVRVESADAALGVARQCPALKHGMTVEVRPVADCCGARSPVEASTA